jgi:hypothetical protein
VRGGYAHSAARGVMGALSQDSPGEIQRRRGASGDQTHAQGRTYTHTNRRPATQTAGHAVVHNLLSK